MTWAPWDFLELTTSARRRFKPAGEDDSIVLDSREVETAIKIKASDQVSYESSLLIEGSEEVGANLKSLSFELKNRATYQAMENFAFFAEFQKEWEKTLDTVAGTSEKEKATIALIGIEAKL
jgi:hypothetical protein